MSEKKTRFIFVSGGVISGLGKGITAASLGVLLKSRGYSVSILKADMYLNIDAGTMNPLEHGEVFVTADGLETDQDLGHYERFLNTDLKRHDYFTMGQVYKSVLEKERSLEYEGKCVEGNVHIPEEIIKRILHASNLDGSDIFIVEVGGTVGEYQNMMFFEALRRFRQRYPDQVALVHVVYLPVPRFLGEMKSKPAQASIYELYRLGLQPDFVVCRADEEIDQKRKHTIAFNTGVKEDNIIANPDVDSIYKVPVMFKEQEFDEKVLTELKLESKKNDFSEWESLIRSIDSSKGEVKVAIAGKYFTSGNFFLEDSYVCVIEAIKHAAWKLGKRPVIKWFDVQGMEDAEKRKSLEQELKSYDGIVVPQGWGSRGVEGKLAIVKFAREHKIPYLGLCFGMQMAVIEFARNVLGLKGANSTEADSNTSYPVVHVMPKQEEYIKKRQYGGTIRLGNWPCKLMEGSLLQRLYLEHEGVSGVVEERHRHRYEVNNEYKQALSSKGMIFSGTSPDGALAEAIELDKNLHPFFVASQFHPEYRSRPLRPHPMFLAFIKACARIV